MRNIFDNENEVLFHCFNLLNTAMFILKTEVTKSQNTDLEKTVTSASCIQKQCLLIFRFQVRHILKFNFKHDSKCMKCFSFSNLVLTQVTYSEIHNRTHIFHLGKKHLSSILSLTVCVYMCIYIYLQAHVAFAGSLSFAYKVSVDT